MNETITTLNSTYEVDWAANKIRRLSGANKPTPDQSDDGEWQQAELLKVVAAGGGHVLYMFWGGGRLTVSSLIVQRETGDVA